MRINHLAKFASATHGMLIGARLNRFEVDASKIMGGTCFPLRRCEHGRSLLQPEPKGESRDPSLGRSVHGELAVKIWSVGGPRSRHTPSNPSMNVLVSEYRGSEKHKNRPARGAKGTLCPEWTHNTLQARLGNDPFKHEWAKTEAYALFLAAIRSHEDEERLYATKNGIAFEAKRTNDGTWHGYPIPWQSVPPEIVDLWRTQNAVNKRQLKQHAVYSDDNIHWALESDL